MDVGQKEKLRPVAIFGATIGPSQPKGPRASTYRVSWSVQNRPHKSLTRLALATVVTVLAHLLFGFALFGPIGKQIGRSSHGSFSLGAVGLRKGDAIDETSVLVFIEFNHSLPTEDPLAIPIPTNDFGIDSQVISIREPELHFSGSALEESDIRDDEAVDTTGAAFLFGRYTEQIKARIERAWRYAPTLLDHAFECTAEIEQQRDGRVSQITLVRCDAAPDWQLSLVRAIEAAAPLPSSPDDKLFARTIVLSFVAENQFQAADSKKKDVNLSRATVLQQPIKPLDVVKQIERQLALSLDSNAVKQTPAGLLTRVEAEIIRAQKNQVLGSANGAESDAQIPVRRPGEH